MGVLLHPHYRNVLLSFEKQKKVFAHTEKDFIFAVRLFTKGLCKLHFYLLRADWKKDRKFFTKTLVW